MVSLRKISVFFVFAVCFAMPARAEERPELLWFEVNQERSRVFAYVKRAGLTLSLAIT